MPWKPDQDGGKKYELSLYCKEELPTWDELYNEFYLKKIFQYDPRLPDHEEPDVYWNRPRRKMLLAWACNQLNKMVFEDGIDVTKFIRVKYNIPFEKLHFVLIEESALNMDSLPEYFEELINLNRAPSIYSCKLPSTNLPSIFQTDYPRIDIDTLKGPIRIIAIPSTDAGLSLSTPQEFQDVITFVLKDVIKYFENGVGWKDESRAVSADFEIL